MNKYDLVVIGAGPSGYAAAMRSLDFKKKTLIIERSQVGGAGVANGALSSKTWWELARETASFRKNLKRFDIKVPRINYKEIQDEVRNAVLERRTMLEERLTLMGSTAECQGLVTFREGTARLIRQNAIEIPNGSGKEVVWGDCIVLATGSRPRTLPGIALDADYVMTSDG